MSDIQGMLSEYEEDRQTGMDISAMGKLIYEYTSGYPFLVSSIMPSIPEFFRTANRHTEA